MKRLLLFVILIISYNSCDYYDCADDKVENDKNYEFRIITQSQTINELSNLYLEAELIDEYNLLNSDNIIWEINSNNATLSSTSGKIVLFNALDVNGNQNVLIKAFPESDQENIKQITITILDTNSYLDTSVCFERDVLPIFRANCALSGCHSDVNPEDDLALTSYSKIMKEIKPYRADDSEIFEKIIETKNDEVMPPPPYKRLSTEQIEIIRRWINEGAKNEDCKENTGCDLTNITYSNTIEMIIANNCLGCHSGAVKQGGIDLSNKNSVENSIKNGRIIPAIEHQSGFSPMPQGGKLSDCDIDKIKKWSEEGYK